uniref:G-protein coupled receptors family 1 profile domain-containing protein n=1 Tax=Parascaris univalens TaxID=6257 RepID=A0A915B9C8_PARUN
VMVATQRDSCDPVEKSGEYWMEMNETVRRLLCNSADRLYFDSPLMKLIFISELVGSTVAAAFAALMALAILLTRVLHFNVRLLLVCTCVAMLISNTGSAVYLCSSCVFKKLPLF